MLGVADDRFIPGFIAKNKRIIAHVRAARADYGYGGCFMSQAQVSSAAVQHRFCSCSCFV